MSTVEFLRISQWHHSVEIPFSIAVPDKQVMEEMAKCGRTVEYISQDIFKLWQNCGKTACLFCNLGLIPQFFHTLVIT